MNDNSKKTWWFHNKVKCRRARAREPHTRPITCRFRPYERSVRPKWRPYVRADFSLGSAPSLYALFACLGDAVAEGEVAFFFVGGFAEAEKVSGVAPRSAREARKVPTPLPFPL